MKTNKLFMAAIVAAFVSFTLSSCGPPVCTYESDKECFCAANPTDSRCDTTPPIKPAVVIEVSQTSVTVEKGSSVTITATLKDEDGKVVAGNVSWASNETTIAMVINGTITGMAVGTTKVVASYGALTAFIDVEVKPPLQQIDHPSLNGSHYYVIFVSASPRAIIADRIDADLSPNGEDTNLDPTCKRLWIWPNGDSYSSNTTSGVNSYNVSEGWMSFTMGTLGWAGAGYCVYVPELINSMKAITDNYADYYLHIAYKSQQAGRNTIFQLPYGAPDPQPNVVIGEGTNGKAAYAECTKWDAPNTITTFHADGEWYHFDIPISYFVNQGLIYKDDFVNTGTTGRNVFVFLSNGNPAGTTVDYDAVFIYKKTAR